MYKTPSVCTCGSVVQLYFLRCTFTSCTYSPFVRSRCTSPTSRRCPPSRMEILKYTGFAGSGHFCVVLLVSCTVKLPQLELDILRHTENHRNFWYRWWLQDNCRIGLHYWGYRHEQIDSTQHKNFSGLHLVKFNTIELTLGIILHFFTALHKRVIKRPSH